MTRIPARHSSRRFTSLIAAAALALTAALAAASPALGARSVVPAGEPGGLLADASSDRAGAATDLVTSFTLTPSPPPEDGGGTLRDSIVDLPVGMAGNPQAVAQCPILITPGSAVPTCSEGSQVGLVEINYEKPAFPFPGFPPAPQKWVLPLYNMVAEPGDLATLAFILGGTQAPVSIGIDLRPGDYGIRTRTVRTPQVLPVNNVKITTWGVPAAAEHDIRRCKVPLPIEAFDVTTERGCTGSEDLSEPHGVGVPLKPFLINPTSCAGPRRTTVSVAAWDEPGVLGSEAAEDVTPLECDGVPFAASLDARPSSSQADSPSGLVVDLTVPQSDAADGLAASHLKKAIVTLPKGMSVNPSNAGGLGGCSPAQIGLGTDHPVACPGSSKIGTIRLDTPVLADPVPGEVYLAQPSDNPFGSLIALYIVADLPNGQQVRLPGRIDTDPQTGRLTATFDDNPQLPFSNLHLELKSGPRAPLITPRQCGTYTTEADLYPWARPTAPVHSSSTFHITSGPNGTACPGPNQLNAIFEAGTQSPFAGTYSPLIVNASRPDGSEPLSGMNLQLPPGLTGKLAGIPYCSDAGIAQAGGRNQPGQGAQEIASPSCPAASQVGSVDVAAGAGPSPYHVQGKAYLAGPYKGAPLSLVVITPAVAGPFDLGVVAVRAALRVDPITAQISAESDPIPQILHGIPLKIRSISVKADKPDFTLNPTNCEPMSLTGTLFGPSASAPVANRFQVGACKALDFKPRLALRVFGKTHRNAKPRFRAVLQSRPGEANIARAQVNLPHSEFLEQNHIKTICTRVQWNAGAGHGSQCPQGSIYGHATAWTPLLDQPLQGAVYLRSSSHKLPDLVAALNGQVDIELAGKVDSGKNHGLRNTFEVVPDAPVSKFILEMKGKRKGLLVNSENLCSMKAKTRAIVRFTGQNGAVHAFKPKVANACGKKKQRRHGKHRSR